MAAAVSNVTAQSTCHPCYYIMSAYPYTILSSMGPGMWVSLPGHSVSDEPVGFGYVGVVNAASHCQDLVLVGAVVFPTGNTNIIIKR